MVCFARRREGDNPPRKGLRIATGTITGSRDPGGAGDGGSSFRLLNGSGCQISSVGFVSVGDGGHEIESYELGSSTRVQCLPAYPFGHSLRGSIYP